MRHFLLFCDKLTYAGNLNNLDHLDKNEYIFSEGDICDKALIGSLFKKYKFIAVFHFTAESHVDRSIDGHEEIITSNIVGTYNLIEESRRYIIEIKQDFKFFHVSTDEVYGDLEEVAFLKKQRLIALVLLIQHQKLVKKLPNDYAKYLRRLVD